MSQNDANRSQLCGLEKAPARTVSYDQRLELTDESHIVPFVGCLMPLWSSSITAERAAVRETARSILDCVMAQHKYLDELLAVINAANNVSTKKWIDDLLGDEVRVDPEYTGKKVSTRPHRQDPGAIC